MEFIEVKNLGRGSHGVVELVKMTKPVPMLLAVKSSPSPSSSLQKEFRILPQFLGLPNIVQCHGALFSSKYDKLFLEYASGGSLKDLIKKYGGKIPEPDVRHYTAMILQGLFYIHRKGYVHCDIKPHNILVYPSDESCSRCTLKLADFGLAKEPGERETKVSRGCFRGTARYMPPESVRLGEITAALDIWSLGCVVVMMMTGEPPWGSSVTDWYDLEEKIGWSTDTPDIPGDMSAAGKDFLNKCFDRDPRQRWTVEKLIWHPFVFESPLLAVNHLLD
ncbi:mitogen-activated protein kinase kinase kinase 21 [Hibiscus trionum]|uniref:Mitogen-activated protein kinase kinase kinase 21 n=1 Tax=Hibiscus trionum TaxID=183268 RepID=A0A9W7I227_HIBTR|nr:mitogen-activated protein kinase kinase kinase 21 [Hibiscus trionum]